MKEIKKPLRDDSWKKKLSV